MSFAPGATVLIDFPGAEVHGKTGVVIESRNDFAYGPESVGPIVWVRVLGIVSAVHPAHISGTSEAKQRRQWDAQERGEAVERKQGELF